ncbi:MAG: hypothetical protein JXL82_04435 [Candidatus Omnitrophica bacterium]|nr:hypothetical protein [Candidatus Omnitrophota bacterium]
MKKGRLSMLIFVTFGIITSIFQLIFLREFSFSIAKNELSFIIAAGFWIIFCSLGSITKTPHKFKGLPLLLAASLSFFISISLIHLVKLLSGLKYYETASLRLLLVSSIALIGPTAFIIGNIFRGLVQEYLKVNPPQKNVYAKFFAFEAIGFIIGGVAFTVYLNNYTNPLFFSLLPVLLVLGIKNSYKKILVTALIISLTFCSFKLFSFILQKELGNAKIILNLGSRYGPILSVYKESTTAIFSEGSLLATSEDKAATEEFIHISLSALSTSNKKDILFIGAVLSGQAEEIIKYKPDSLDCLQINPIISKLAKEKLPGEIKAKVNFITDDPRVYLKNTNKRYDAILMDMPAPASLSLNRYFTEGFFKLISLRLKPPGTFSFSIPSKREILSPQFSKFNSSIISAVDKVFENKIIIPSNAMIITASNAGRIRGEDLIKNFSEVNPQTDFFTIYHFKDSLNPAMQSYIQNNLDRKTETNTDLNPTGFLNYLILEQIKFYPDLKIDSIKMRGFIIIILSLLAIFIMALAFLSKKISCLLNTGAIGFTSIGLSSIIFVLFQTYCGGLFWKLGLLIALFMAGLSIGTFLMSRLNTRLNNLLPLIYLSWAIAIFGLSSILKIIGGLNYADIIFYLYALICGILTGASYPLLAESLKENKFNPKNITTTIYSADLAGAFLGTLFCGVILIPFLGVPKSLIVLLTLNIIFAFKNMRH